MKRKLVTAGSFRGDRGHKIRLETRAREFMVVARLRDVKTPKRSESNKSAACKGRRLKGREVTGVRPETGRSIREQAEARGNSGGGPNKY